MYFLQVIYLLKVINVLLMINVLYVLLVLVVNEMILELGLYIIYFMWYDTYHDTHEAISICINDTFCLVLDNKKIDRSTNFMEI